MGRHIFATTQENQMIRQIDALTEEFIAELFGALVEKAVNRGWSCFRLKVKQENIYLADVMMSGPDAAPMWLQRLATPITSGNVQAEMTCSGSDEGARKPLVAEYEFQIQ
jgi:hypothetical protein